MFRLLFFIATSCLTLNVIAQPIKVMTYNIRYDNPDDGVNAWPNRKEKVYSLLKKYNPDIVGVQEALHHQLNDIKQNLKGYQYLGAGRDDGKQKGEYAAIFFREKRFKIIDQNTFWLSKTPEVAGSKDWDAAITRVATWAIMLDKKTNKKFLILNTHFDHIGKEARANSAILIKVKIKEIAKNIPVIITGDFNITRDEQPYFTMMNDEVFHVNDPAPKNPEGTFCTFVRDSIVCKAIDYIFYTNEWQAEDYSVIKDNDGKHYPSDHLPVMVTFTLQK